MNGLKTINDTQGHAAGDKALTTIAICFLKAALPRQTVYRIGGDEFVIILMGEDYDDRELLLEQLQNEIYRQIEDETILPWDRCSFAIRRTDA